MAREGRKFKVGLCAVTQQPKLLDGELLSQFNTFFILGLADEKDRNILRSSSKQDIAALGPEIQTLMPGECLVANLDAPFAVPAKVHLYDEWLATAPPPAAPREPAGRGHVGALRLSRLVALGDAHLGRAYYQVVDPNGVNQRELDFEESCTGPSSPPWPDPDAVLAGRRLRPPPAHLPVVPGGPAGLRTLAEPGVPTVVITGNHDTPRLPGPARPTRRWPTPSPTSTSPTGAYERFDLLAGLRVHAVPQMLTVDRPSGPSPPRPTPAPATTNLLLTHPP